MKNLIQDWHNSYDESKIGFQELPANMRLAAGLKPYYIISQGGCGTTYLRSFLERYCYGDHMGYSSRFGGCSWNEHSKNPNVGNKNILYVYGNPCDATMSFYGRAFMEVSDHANRIGGDVNGLLSNRPWTLEKYVTNGVDYFQLEDHFRTWLDFDQRDYKIMFVKYTELPIHIEAILDWLGFSSEQAKHFVFKERGSKWLQQNKIITDGFKSMFSTYLELQDSLPGNFIL
jgi:hypothetical protein